MNIPVYIECPHHTLHLAWLHPTTLLNFFTLPLKSGKIIYCLCSNIFFFILEVGISNPVDILFLARSYSSSCHNDVLKNTGPPAWVHCPASTKAWDSCSILRIVLYCTVVYCTVLYCTCIVLHCTVLYLRMVTPMSPSSGSR